MHTTQQRETDETLIKFNFEPATEQEAKEVSSRVMDRLLNADKSTLRNIVLLMAGNLVEMTCSPCDEYTFSTAAFGLIQGFADEVEQAEINGGKFHETGGHA